MKGRLKGDLKGFKGGFQGLKGLKGLEGLKRGLPELEGIEVPTRQMECNIGFKLVHAWHMLQDKDKP